MDNSRLLRPQFNFDALFHQSDKTYSCSNRSDVRAKKILRACRSYYEDILDQVYGIKNLNRTVNQSDKLELLSCCESFCKEVFDNELLQMFDVTVERIAKHLAAFICASKSLASMHIIASTAKSQQMKEIADLISQARSLLYDYKKPNFNTFMDQIENILIIEQFLNHQNHIRLDQSKPVNATSSRRQ